MQAKIAHAALFSTAVLCSLLVTTAASQAGDGHGADLAVQVELQARHLQAPSRHRHVVIAAPGPAIYYGAYPDHIPGLPVPIFPTHRPVLAHQLVVSLSARHVRWCHARFHSYRARDNTFQPFHGPRRQCRSPSA